MSSGAMLGAMLGAFLLLGIISELVERHGRAKADRELLRDPSLYTRSQVRLAIRGAVITNDAEASIRNAEWVADVVLAELDAGRVYDGQAWRGLDEVRP